jgi:transposase
MPTKLDAYKAIIEARLAVYPPLSAVGCSTRFGGRLHRRLHAVESVRAPAPTGDRARAGIRFETAAGRQAQLDFSRPLRAGIRDALRVMLGDSRLRWCRFCARPDLRTLIDGLEEAFGYFGAVPQELPSIRRGR